MNKKKVRYFLIAMLCVASFSACLFINLNAKAIPTSMNAEKIEQTNDSNPRVYPSDVEVFVHLAKKVSEVIYFLPQK